MAELVTAPLSAKAQLTLPKKVREFLGVRAKGEVVGFVIDKKARRITVTKVDLVPAEESYTDEEIRALLKLAKEPGGQTFDSAEAFLKHLHSL